MPNLKVICLAVAVALVPAAARADGLSLAAGGLLTTSPTQAGGAALITTAASIPATPVAVQATVMVPLVTGGGYALTGEIRGLTGGGFGGAYVGAGIGVGRLAADRVAGPVVTVFAGKGIAPLLSLEARAYLATREGGVAGGFLGLRLTL